MKLSHQIPQTPWRATSSWGLRPRMVAPLAIGLTLFGIGEGLLVQSHWGATPWTVFAEGVSRHAHVSLGWSTAAISCVVLLAWFPLRERPGFGTIINLMVSAGHMTTFFASSIVIIMVPGPSVLFTLASGVACGRAVAVLTVLGNRIGTLLLSVV